MITPKYSTLNVLITSLQKHHPRKIWYGRHNIKHEFFWPKLQTPTESKFSGILLIKKQLPVSTINLDPNIPHFFALAGSIDRITIKWVCMKTKMQNNEVYNVIHHDNSFRQHCALKSNYQLVRYILFYINFIWREIVFPWYFLHTFNFVHKL